MNETIQWPGGDFTIQQAVELNPSIPEATIRKELSRATAAKKIVQTKKGDGKIKGTFKTAGEATINPS